MERVGIRDLKANLSRHLKQVRRGRPLQVTERGRAIATIQPVEPALRSAWAHELVRTGAARWSGGKPSGAGRPGRARPGASVSVAVLEDRR